MGCTHMMIYRLRSALLLSVTAGALVFTGACAKIDMPSHITPEKIQIETQNYSERFKTAEVSAADFDRLAEHFSRYGEGEAEMIISYDPHSRKNTAKKASEQMHRISSEFRRRGLGSLKSSVMALENSGDESEMIIGYTSVTALPPKDCYTMPGFDSRQTHIDTDYQLGCTLDTAMTRQITRPGDLEGRSYGDQDGDARRGAAVVEPYRAGEGSEGLGGYSVGN